MVWRMSTRWFVRSRKKNWDKVRLGIISGVSEAASGTQDADVSDEEDNDPPSPSKAKLFGSDEDDDAVENEFI